MSKNNLPAVQSRSITIENRTIFFSQKDGEWWIALKPICEALGLDWTRYFKNAKADPILGELLAEQPMVAGDRKPRMMTCLPERFIYGWLFQIDSKNPKLLAFKRQCYDALFDHFHGKTVNRSQAIREKLLALREAEQLRKQLESDPRYRRLKELDGVVMAKGKELKAADRAIEQEQLSLFAADADE